MAQIKKLFDVKRVPLHEVLPLDAPFMVRIEVANYCNSRCKFCYYSHESDSSQKNKNIPRLMSDETFELLIKQLQQFPSNIKAVGIDGVGEPLLHPKLPYFIERLKKEAGIEKISINTNGFNLSEKLSLELIEAGLDSIKVSVNGLSSKMYKENCGVDMDFDKFKKQIAFFHKNKKRATIACKILDCCFDEGESEEDFFNIFGDICDEMDIEKTVSVFERGGIDYSAVIVGEDAKQVISRYELRRNRIKVCPSPFFRMCMLVSGEVLICRFFMGITTPNMDIRKQTLLEIWNGEERKILLQGVLRGEESGLLENCKNCTFKDDLAFDADLLDDHADEIYKRISNS